MRKKLIFSSFLVLMLAGNVCYSMKPQEVPETRSRSKSYVIPREEEKDSKKSWFKSLTSKLNKHKAKEKSAEAKSDLPHSREGRRSFSLILPKAPVKKKHNSVGNTGEKDLVSKVPQATNKELVHEGPQLQQAQILLALSRQAGVLSRSESPELEGEQELNEDASAVAYKPNPSYSAAQVMLARQARLRREKYANGRSGRDSQTKMSAKEYLGDTKWEAALIANSSEEISTVTPRSDDTVTPRSDDSGTPRTEEGTPRADDTTTPREELETPRSDVFVTPRVEGDISLGSSGESKNN